MGRLSDYLRTLLPFFEYELMGFLTVLFHIYKKLKENEYSVLSLVSCELASAYVALTRWPMNMQITITKFEHANNNYQHLDKNNVKFKIF